MPKVSGIDFSVLDNIRESVSVRVADGSVVELPLLKLRDAGVASIYLQRNDTIAVQYANITARMRHKQAMLANVPSDTKGVENGFDVIDGALCTLKDMYKKAEELAKENRELCDEIHKFIAPYLEGTGVLETLEQCEDRYTIDILRLMLYGKEAMKEGEQQGGDDKENPTTPQSQSPLT